MDRFPLPVEVMRIIFEKSRELRRKEGRGRMEPRINKFGRRLDRSRRMWTFDWWDMVTHEHDLPCEEGEASDLALWVDPPKTNLRIWIYVDLVHGREPCSGFDHLS
jgi:hypothetical protein